jgi:putative ABC transport system permease protein
MNALTIACRSLARRPSFTITAVLTLAFGVSTTTAMFSVVDAVLLKPLPFPNADRLVTVMESNPARTQSISLVAPGRLLDWDHANRTFEALSGSYAENVTDTSDVEPQRLQGRRVAPRYFAVFGMAPSAGRTFSEDEERFGGPQAAVISDGLWTRRYGHAATAIGRRLVFGGVGYTIVGVMPAAFTSAAIDLWLPAQTAPGLLRVREARFLSGVGRMKPGVTMAQATADLARVQQTLGDQYPASDRGWSVSVGDMKELRVGEYRRALWLVFAAVALLFAIAIANIAGLMLVQLFRRAREFSIRQAIGASRPQIIGAVMCEVAMMAAAGSIAGAAAAFGLADLFAKTFATVPRMNELTLDWRALVFSATATAAAGVAFGLWPSLHATRGDLAPVLARGGRGASGVRHRWQQALVVLQIALSILLAASAGLMLRSYYNLIHVDTGFSPAHAIIFHVGAAWDEDRARVGQMQERLIGELQQIPGVVAAGMTNFLPSTGATLRFQIELEGVATADDHGNITVGERTVSDGYLRALGVPLVAGAWCPPFHYDFKAPPKALVNHAFADRYGPDLVGRHFMFDQSRSSHEIVGIVGDLTEDGPSVAPAPYVYACESAGTWPDPEYVVRTSGDPRVLIPTIRQIAHRLDSNRAIFGVKMVEDVIAGALDQPRLNARMLTLFAAIAMAFASVGLYSLLMLLVSERTRELSVRMALGARRAQVVGLVLGGAGRLLAAGIAAGLLLTAAMARIFRTVLFGVSPVNGPTLSAVVAVLALVALGAAAVPAWRAATIDPNEAMRADSN